MQVLDVSSRHSVQAARPIRLADDTIWARRVPIIYFGHIRHYAPPQLARGFQTGHLTGMCPSSPTSVVSRA